MRRACRGALRLHALVFLLREFQILRGGVGARIDVERRFEKRDRLGELLLVVQRQPLIELLLPAASCCLPGLILLPDLRQLLHDRR